MRTLWPALTAYLGTKSPLDILLARSTTCSTCSDAPSLSGQMEDPHKNQDNTEPMRRAGAAVVILTALCMLIGGAAYSWARSSRLGSVRVMASSGGVMLGRFTDKIDNTFDKYLTGYKADQFTCREITGAHYVPTKPEKLSGKPYFVGASASLADTLGLDPAIFLEKSSEELDAFVNAFSGNEMLPNASPFASVYGCHCYGTWFGQLGDGRAMSFAEVVGKDNVRYELQMKGCGRSPFSRGFDGKAVLRSSTREFLASESMYHLNVETTRALSLVGTGESIRRAWYSSKEPRDKSHPHYASKYPPDQLVSEKGAITTRVAKSFIRFAQLELFAKRGEQDELLALMDYACFREHPELLSPEDYLDNVVTKRDSSDSEAILPVRMIRPGPLERYVEFYRKIGQNAVKLVVDWIRVGYVQGNMNSDNTLIGGRTLDYGPFGFMERYSPLYQPFTSDQDGKFAFMRQPSAMQMNMVTLSEAFDEVIKFRGEQLKCKQSEIDAALTKINHIVREDFVANFQESFNRMRAAKLGLTEWKQGDNELYAKLDQNMVDAVDYTLFYRLLSGVSTEDDPAESLSRVEACFYKEVDYDTSSVWMAWFQDYLLRIRAQELPDAARKEGMDKVNPKYILRNWMGTLAYESAENGDYSMLREIQECLQRPYEEQSEDTSDKYFRKTPPAFQQKPGVAFMS